MRNFRCACGNTVYFENSQCLACRRALGFVPARLKLSALEPLADGSVRALLDGARYRVCRNGLEFEVCNWLVAAADPQPYCPACRLNRLIPDLSAPRNRRLWARIERAKRRLLYGLYALRLPVFGRDRDPQAGLAFEFLAEPAAEGEFSDDAAGQRVMTGHRAGVITINIAEADPGAREQLRERLGEQYRTLLGHFRHEIAHWYWERLVRDGPWLEGFRARFGDERADYAAALARYYAAGPRPDWQRDAVSAYASAHPWEDWAETWAHFLHMVDTLETAHDHGFALDGRPLRAPGLLPESPVPEPAPFDELIDNWVRLTLALNALNRSMGLRDAYPFVLGPGAVEKLRFVHRVIAAAAGSG